MNHDRDDTDDRSDADTTPHAARDATHDTIRPNVRDRFERRVRDDHAPNAALHSALRALAESDASRVTNVNLMASHAPGEKDHDPTYDVVVDIENAGAGSAATFGTIVRKLVRYDDVVIRDAEATSIPTHSDAHDADTDYAIDRLTLHLRPVETRVEPVEIPIRAIPDDVRGIGEGTVAAVLGDIETRLNEEFRSVSPLRVFRDVVDDWGDVLPDPDVDGASRRLQSLDTRLEDFPDGWRDQMVGPVYLEDNIEATIAVQDPDDNSIVATADTRAGEWHTVDTGRGIWDIRVDVDDDREGFEYEYGDRITFLCPKCGDNDLTVGVTNPWYKCHECGATGDTADVDAFPDHDDVYFPPSSERFPANASATDAPETLAEATASGLGLAAVAETIARHEDAPGVRRESLNLDDDAIDKAVDRGVVMKRVVDGHTLLFDTRDVARNVMARVDEGATDE